MVFRAVVAFLCVLALVADALLPAFVRETCENGCRSPLPFVLVIGVAAVAGLAWAWVTWPPDGGEDSGGERR